MNLHRFDLNLLRSLDALLQEQSVARAARRVGLSQPAMSAALKRLREYLQDPILNSVGRGMALSARGQALIEPVREALLSLEGIFDIRPTFDAAALRQSFHMAIADFLTPTILPRFLSKLAIEAPHVSCHIERVTDSTLRRLLAGDIVLGYWPYDVSLFGSADPAEALQSCAIRSSPWRCIAAEDHPSITGALSLEQYRTLPHIVPRPGLDTHHMEDVWRQTLHADLNIVASTNSLLDLPAIVAGTRLIATVPESMLESLSFALPIRVMPLPVEAPPLTETLYWHERHEADPAHRWLRALFRDCALTSRQVH